jgi:uncharacterized Ntn-hydrolase superfamily protein
MRLGLLACTVLVKMNSPFAAVCVANDAGPTPEVHTFSIVAYDPISGDLGVAVQSKYFGVGSVVPWARAGVGAIATQASAKVSFGPEGLKLLAAGKASQEVVAALTEPDEKRDLRQLGVVDAKGTVAAFTGAHCISWAGHREGDHYAVQGNLLAGEDVIRFMAESFEKARASGAGSELADWLVAALQAGQAAGGDKRGQQSAALLVVRQNAGPGGDNDRYVDLRVEDHTEPIKELARLLQLHKAFYAEAHRRARSDGR